MDLKLFNFLERKKESSLGGRPVLRCYLRGMITTRLLLLSDIHGSLPALERALALGQRAGCEELLLMGDVLNYGPRNGLPEGLDAPAVAQRLNELAPRITAIRGNCDSEVDQMLLHFPIMADYATYRTAEGLRLLLTHGHVYHEGLLPGGCRPDVLLTGHTHLWQLRPMEGGGWLCNTGSITFPKGGQPATVATLIGRQLSVFRLSDGQPLATANL